MDNIHNSLYYIKVINLLMFVILFLILMCYIILRKFKNIYNMVIVMVIVSLMLVFFICIYIDIYLLKAMPLCGSSLAVIKLEEQIYRFGTRVIFIITFLSIFQSINFILEKERLSLLLGVLGVSKQYLKLFIKIIWLIRLGLFFLVLIIVLLILSDSILECVMRLYFGLFGVEISEVQRMLHIVTFGVYVLSVSTILLIKQCAQIIIERIKPKLVKRVKGDLK